MAGRQTSRRWGVLSRQQAAFARAFIACGIATQAAREAGYSPNSIKQSASRVLNTPAVQAEIQRLREASRLTIDALLLPRGGVGETADALAVRHQADLSVSAVLDQHYTIAGLVEAFEMALGRMDRAGEQDPRKRRRVDLHAAARLGELLLKHRAPANPRVPAGPDTISPELASVIAGFKSVVASYRARRGETTEIVDIEPDPSGAEGRQGR
jgi:hypothetical protein